MVVDLSSSTVNSRSGLLIRSLNIRSLPSKISLLEADIRDLPDVLALQETWLNPNHSDSSLKIEGYSIVRRDRLDSRGGGVAFYVSDRVGWSIPDIPVVNGIEYLCIDIHDRFLTVRICNVYRPRPYQQPGMNFLYGFLRILLHATTTFLLWGILTLTFQMLVNPRN